MNAVANSKIKTHTPFKNVYIQPAAGDNGLAIGCAYYGWLEVLKKKRVLHDGSPYLGAQYDHSRIDRALDKYRDVFRVERPREWIVRIAEALAAGDTVGWYNGSSEFGPRALGNRSILADPRSPEMKDRINTLIKFREDFRPFAPAVLIEDLTKYFLEDNPSPYMLTVTMVRPEYRDAIPAVVHSDGSARVQTVHRELNPTFYELVSHFRDITGISVLLNTSFNRRGMPIVETPEQAIEFFSRCGLDVLCIDGIIVRKPRSWIQDQELRCREWAARLNECVKQSPMLGSIGGVFQLDISGLQSVTIDLTAIPELRSTRARDADVTISVTQDEMFALSGSTREEVQEAIASQRIKVRGDRQKVELFFARLKMQ